MRDRLIELISQVQYLGGLEGRLADHLLANGVIVPPCKLWDEVYVIENPYTYLPLKKSVVGEVLSFHKHNGGFFVRVLFDTKNIHGCRDYEGWTWGKKLFFDREEAEKALEERSKNGK